MKVSLGRFFAIACCLIGLLLSNSPASSAQTFSATGSMETTRARHTATLLTNGMVLIAGGTVDSSGSAHATAELYSPATKSFTATGNMTVERTHHTATLLNDGTVLIAGGYNSNGTQFTAELYNPATGTFAATTGIMTFSRADHTATLLANGMVLIAGGYNGNGIHISAEVYNPSNQSFTATSGNMTVERELQTASLLSNGTVLIAGGKNSAYLASAELFNPATGTFAATGSMHTARDFHTATVLANGSVLIVGGYSGSTYLASAELYKAGSFTVTSNLAHAREEHTATLQNDGTVLIAGGYSGTFLNSAELYNQTSGAFTGTGNMVAAREASTATLLGSDGLVLVAGGFNTSYLSTAELYAGPVAEMGIANPLFNIVSIVYDAPGNRSNNGFTNTSTQGTTTTIGSSFMVGDSTTFTIGGDFMGNGGSLSWSFGTAATTGNSSAFTETLTDGTGVANDSNSGLNAINHVNDLFVIWLNPAVLMTQTGPTSFNYSTGTQLQVAPNPNPGQPEAIDQVEVYAQVMLPNAQGVTTVPVPILVPQTVGSGALLQTLPGLAHVCARPTFYPNSCTLANQCGCVPSDFTAILAADPLINYTPTESPLNANTSTATQCTNPAATAKCRFVPIMSSPTVQVTALLSGPDIVGGNIPVNTFTQSDSTQTAVTLSESEAVTEGYSWDAKFGVPGFSEDLKSQTTMTWTSSESLGETNGSAHSMTVTLSSSTVGCFENINIFEDIVYHTYVFQQPTGTSCP